MILENLLFIYSLRNLIYIILFSKIISKIILNKNIIRIYLQIFNKERLKNKKIIKYKRR